MKTGNLFWGLVLITLGVLIALRNFGIFFFTWGSLFQLWPLILVFIGISFLPVKSGIKILLTVLTIAVGILILVSNPQSGRFWWNWFEKDKTEKETIQRPWSEQRLEKEYDDNIRHARLKLDAAAGLFILGETTERLYEFETEGNIGPYEATVRTTDDKTAIVQLFGETNIKLKGNIKNTVRIKLNDNPAWELDMNAGAAKVEMDLTPFDFTKINIDGGASAIDIKIGERSKKTSIRINAGASAIKIKVPENSACEVNAKTVLSGRDLIGFNQIERGLYQTPNFSDTANQILIRIDAAVSGVKVERY